MMIYSNFHNSHRYREKLYQVFARKLVEITVKLCTDLVNYCPGHCWKLSGLSGLWTTQEEPRF